MIWEGKRLADVNEADLRKVVESGIEEHKHLDYKAELYASNDAGQKDFLIDICAFANAEGGILLIGVPELRDPGNGQPTGLPDVAKFQGIESSNPESVLQGYDSRVVSCVEERLSLESYAIKLGNGRYVFAIRVPNSLNKPHCVRRDDRRYFPLRRDRHLYYMDVEEIKEMVMRTASRRDQAEQLLLESFTELSGATEKTEKPYLTIGAVPVFWKDFLVDIRNQAILDKMLIFDISGGNTYQQWQFSFKGLERRVREAGTFTQLRRNGLVRHSQPLDVRTTSGNSAIYPSAIDVYLRRFLVRVAALYDAADLSGPFLLGLVIGTKSPIDGIHRDPIAWNRSIVRGTLEAGTQRLPILTAYDFRDIDAVMRPLCDQVHQGFGEEGSPNFDADGKWRDPASAR